MARDTYNSRILTWGVWTAAVGAVGFMAADAVLKLPVMWLRLMPVYCLAVFALLHSFTFLGVRRASWFLALGLIVPFVAEYLGINFNAIFGGHWYYLAKDLGVRVGLVLPGYVPLAVVLSWYGMLYVAFVASVYMLQARRSDISAFATVPLSVGLLMSLWQVAAGPAMVGRAMLSFTQNGFYHSIPLSNFVGWFVVAMFIALFYQIVEPSAVDAGRFAEPDQPRIAPLALFMYGISVLYATAVCLRLGFNGAGWLGVAILILFTLVLAVRSRSAAPKTALSGQPTAA
jgi:uncharacterized membrane protein